MLPRDYEKESGGAGEELRGNTGMLHAISKYGFTNRYSAIIPIPQTKLESGRGVGLSPTRDCS